MTWLAVLLGLGAAALFAVGAVAQQQEASNVSASGAGFIRGLLSSGRWWAATFGDGVGFMLQAAGLAVGSILVVQPLLIMALVFALPLSARWNARPIRRRDLAWAGILAGALVTFLLVGNPDGGVDTNTFREWLPSIVLCATIVVVGGGLAASGSPRLRALGLAMAAGTLFGFASALTKSAISLFGDGLGIGFTSWETYTLLVAGLAGLTCQQLAFQAGSLEISFPAATVLDPVISVVVGIAALDERLQADGLEWVIIGVTAVAMVSGTIALARAGVPTLPSPLAEGTAPSSPTPTT